MEILWAHRNEKFSKFYFPSLKIQIFSSSVGARARAGQIGQTQMAAKGRGTAAAKVDEHQRFL